MRKSVREGVESRRGWDGGGSCFSPLVGEELDRERAELVGALVSALWMVKE